MIPSQSRWEVATTDAGTRPVVATECFVKDGVLSFWDPNSSEPVIQFSLANVIYWRRA